MRRVKFLSLGLLISFLFATLDTMAQDQTKAIGANPVGLLFRIFNAKYEQKLSPTNSFTVQGYYFPLLDWAGYGFGGSYRWYFEKKALEGFSVGPVASIAFWSWTGSVFNYEGGTMVLLGGSAAYKWIFSGGFALEPELMLTFPVNTFTGFSGYSSFGVGLTLGYAWK
jgi:hypothetical protein